MRYYDVTQEVFSSKVFPGDPSPEFERIQDIEKGDSCSLTFIKMCAHNGTHMDAPCHFVRGGKSIEEIEPRRFMGRCRLLCFDGHLDEETARRMIAGKGKKLLWKGDLIISEEAARVFAEEQLEFLGVEGQTVGTEDNTEKVHKILLGADIVIVEGLVLTEADEGEYFLCAMPLKLAGSDGAPCRVVLMREDA